LSPDGLEFLHLSYASAVTFLVRFARIISIYSAVFFCNPAWAEDARAWWLDASAEANLATAQTMQFQPMPRTLSLGYNSAALWIRLKVPSTDEPVGLLVAPNFLNRIELYDPAKPETMHGPLISGRDAKKVALNHFMLNNGFTLSPSPTPRVVYLRITTTSAMTVAVSILGADQANGKSEVEALISAVYISLLTAFAIWSMIAFIVRREAIFGLFIVRQVQSLLHALAYLGYLQFLLADQFSADTREVIYGLVVVATLPITGAADRRILREFHASRHLARLHAATLTLSVPCLFLILAHEPHLALMLNGYLVLLSSVLLLFMAFTTEGNEEPYSVIVMIRL
jgi:hypothetical protein